MQHLHGRGVFRLSVDTPVSLWESFLLDLDRDPGCRRCKIVDQSNWYTALGSKYKESSIMSSQLAEIYVMLLQHLENS